MTVGKWQPIEIHQQTLFEQFSSPLKALSDGTIPAVIFRKGFNPNHYISLVNRFYEKALLYDPRVDYGKAPKRVDIGTSLSKDGHDPDVFFSHANATRDLFRTLFDGFDNPVEYIYRTLSDLAPEKEVKVARESDGRLYGPAIFRTYYEGVGHTPHFDSVRKRSRLFNYAVSRFEKQFAAVLCFQNAMDDKERGQAFLYKKQWSPDIQDVLPRFQAFAAEQGIERIRFGLEPGDFYIFNSETIHEVPPPIGDRPRIVLAVFFAMSDDDKEVYVWS